MKVIFLDTNIFLHFNQFDTIDWLGILNCESCEITIAPIVLDELERKKVGTSKISNRARTVLQRFEKVLESNSPEISKGVHLVVLFQKPLRSIFEQKDLNFDEPDQKLLATVIDFIDKNPSKEVVLCSDDVGVRHRARYFEIATIKLNDEFRLPSEESEVEKRIKELELENLTLKLKIPKLKLTFSSDKDYLKQIPNPPLDLSKDEFIQREISDIKSELKYLETLNKQDSVGNTLSTIAMHLSSLSQDQVKAYNSELDNYFLDYEKYAEALFEFKLQQNLSYSIEFSLFNNGNVPAEDVDIHIHFPDGFAVLEPRDMLKNPKKPSPPYRPKHRMDFGTPILPINLPNPSHPKTSDLNLNRPHIKKTNSYDVNMKCSSIKHSYQISLDKLITVYSSIDDLKSYPIDYEITAANVPKPIKGKLNVVFENRIL